MIQVILVLNKIECLNRLITEFMNNGITGGTILDSHGMVRTAKNFGDNPIFDMFREIFDIDETNSSKVIFMIAEESQVRTISKIVNEVTGGLQNPNTGILFCTPVIYIEGLRKNKPHKDVEGE